MPGATAISQCKIRPEKQRETSILGNTTISQYKTRIERDGYARKYGDQLM